MAADSCVVIEIEQTDLPFAARIPGQGEAVNAAINSRKISGIRMSNFVCWDTICSALLTELTSAGQKGNFMPFLQFAGWRTSANNILTQQEET